MSTTDTPITNVVLVHGAFADGSGWRGVHERLTDRGYRVTIVQNPLMGHSWGGTVITEAGAHDKVAGLVYVAALVPDAGQSSGQQQAGFAADLSDAEAAFMRDAQVPVNMSVFAETVSRAAWRDKPSWAVFGTEDKAFDQAMLTHMAERAGATITTVPGSHAVYASQPDAVADVILTAAKEAAAA